MKAFYENIKYESDISIDTIFCNNHDFFAHWHNDIELIYVLEGTIGIGINSEYQVFNKGEMCICKANDIHYYDSKNMQSKIFVVIFHPDILCSTKFWQDELTPCSLSLNKSFLTNNNISDDILLNIKKIFNNIIEEQNNKTSLSTQYITIRIYELFLLLFRCIPSYYNYSTNKTQSELSGSVGHIQKAIKYLKNNYMKDISLETVANEINLNSFYLSRLFNKTTGTTFNNYLTNIRIKKAEELIRNTQKHMIEIAYETGFQSIRTFNRSFKRLKGSTPHSLRG